MVHCFQGDQNFTEDDHHSGRPCISVTDENVEQFQQLIHKDCRQTIHALCCFY